MRRLPLLLVLATLTACGQKTATGLYVMRAPDGLVTVELVETSDRRLSGRAEFEVIRADGDVTDRSDRATGAVGDGTITLDLKPEGLLDDTLSVSGSLRGDVLTLDGTGARGHFHLVLNRTSQEKVQAALADLAARSQARREAIRIAKQADEDRKAKDGFIQNAVDVGDEDDDFVDRVHRDLPLLSKVDEDFRRATAAMQAKLEQEKNIFGDGQPAAERSQLYVQVVQISVAANSENITLGAKEQELRAKIDGLGQQTGAIAQTCHRAHQPTHADPIKPGYELLNTDCLLLLQSAGRFEAARNKVTNAMAATESVWLQEKAKQDQVEREAQEATH